MLNAPDTTSNVQQALTLTVRTRQCGHTVWGKIQIKIFSRVQTLKIKAHVSGASNIMGYKKIMGYEKACWYSVGSGWFVYKQAAQPISVMDGYLTQLIVFNSRKFNGTYRCKWKCRWLKVVQKSGADNGKQNNLNHCHMLGLFSKSMVSLFEFCSCFLSCMHALCIVQRIEIWVQGGAWNKITRE